jgi:hypothetical protein
LVSEIPVGDGKMANLFYSVGRSDKLYAFYGRIFVGILSGNKPVTFIGRANTVEALSRDPNRKCTSLGALADTDEKFFL